MPIRLDGSTLRETRWYEYLLRFFFGGLITAVAGVIAQRFGPIIGGLFLAFPAIFPASATLIEKHEREKKEIKGLSGKQRGRNAAALEAVGSAIGKCRSVIFRGFTLASAATHRPSLVLAGATYAWGFASAGIWRLRKTF